MKHIQGMSSTAPAKAILPPGHPDLGDSIAGLLANPIGILIFHFNVLVGKVNEQVN